MVFVGRFRERRQRRYKSVLIGDECWPSLFWFLLHFGDLSGKSAGNYVAASCAAVKSGRKQRALALMGSVRN